MEFHSESEEKLIEIVWGEIKGSIRAGFVCALVGELGAGKTVLAKGIARKLGVRGQVASPTFNLRKIYPLKEKTNGAKFFQHIDLYRFDNPSSYELAEVMDWIGETDSITFIEWAQNISAVEKRADFVVKIRALSENERKIVIIRKR
jgi:tRNA threonylcarbamoyladenosine biosynthesis protein TsaE